MWLIVAPGGTTEPTCRFSVLPVISTFPARVRCGAVPVTRALSLTAAQILLNMLFSGGLRAKKHFLQSWTDL
jgi:hypothetical protein